MESVSVSGIEQLVREQVVRNKGFIGNTGLVTAASGSKFANSGLTSELKSAVQVSATAPEELDPTLKFIGELETRLTDAYSEEDFIAIRMKYCGKIRTDYDNLMLRLFGYLSGMIVIEYGCLKYRQERILRNGDIKTGWTAIETISTSVNSGVINYVNDVPLLHPVSFGCERYSFDGSDQVDVHRQLRRVDSRLIALYDDNKEVWISAIVNLGARKYFEKRFGTKIKEEHLAPKPVQYDPDVTITAVLY
jgi:hypothetical protein